jgi:hypothetical protein
MGLKDAAAKNFFGRQDVLAELADCFLFGRRRILRNSQLTDLCGEHPRIVRTEGGGYRTDNRYRDKLFDCDTGDETVSINVEYQAKNDKRMIPRVMDYNARLLNSLIDSDGQVHRIMNLVLSFDASNNRTPCELMQMLDKKKSVFDKYFFNYGYVSLNIYDIAEKLDMFPCGELKNVLYLFNCAKENGRCMADMAKGTLKRFRRMSRDAALVCAVFLGFELDIDDDMEEIDMCKMVRDFKRKCKNEGRREGKAEGLKEGKTEGLKEGEAKGLKKGKAEGLKEGERNAFRKFVARLLSQSRSILEICDLTGASEEDVREVALSIQS